MTKNGKLSAGLVIGAFVVLSTGAVGQFAWLINGQACLMDRVGRLEAEIEALHDKVDLLGAVIGVPNVSND